MPNNVPYRIRPTKATEVISMSGVQYRDIFKKKFHNPKLVEFFVFGKVVYGNDVHLQIRSMRVNEFVKMLDDFGIKWKHLKDPKY